MSSNHTTVARTATGRSLRRLATRTITGIALVLTAVSAAAADCRMQPMTIPVHIVNYRPIATLTLNGTEVRMLLDSGASDSFVFPSTAEALQLTLRPMPYGRTIVGYTGNIKARMTRVAKVGLGSAELKDVEDRKSVV